jgi:hypothetical protein
MRSRGRVGLDFGVLKMKKSTENLNSNIMTHLTEIKESPVALLADSTDRAMLHDSALVVVVPSSESDRSLEGISDNEADTAVLVSMNDIERELSLKNSSRGCNSEKLTPKGCKSKFKRHKIPPPGLYPLNFSPYQMSPRQLNFHALPRCHARLVCTPYII